VCELRQRAWHRQQARRLQARLATLLLEDGAHPKFVQEWLRHSRISVTMDTCSLVIPTMRDCNFAKCSNADSAVANGRALARLLPTSRFRPAQRP